MFDEAAQCARRFVGVGALSLAALLGAMVLIAQRGGSERNTMFPSELDICRAPPNGALSFWVSPSYIAAEKGTLVRYRCTFCNSHPPLALFFEEDAIALISEGGP